MPCNHKPICGSQCTHPEHAVRSRTTPYQGPVVTLFRDYCRAAHGGITIHDYCDACHHVRRTNRNGRHEESTGWRPSKALQQIRRSHRRVHIDPRWLAWLVTPAEPITRDSKVRLEGKDLTPGVYSVRDLLDAADQHRPHPLYTALKSWMREFARDDARADFRPGGGAS